MADATERSTRAPLAALVALRVLLALAPLGCGNLRDTAGVVGDGGGADASLTDAGSGAGDGGNGLIDGKPVASLAIQPAAATIVTTGSPVSQPFQAVATFTDGTTETVTAQVAWGWDDPGVGGVGAPGLYTAGGSLGGVVHVTASGGGHTATAALTVQLHLPVSDGGVPAGTQGALGAATIPDPAVLMAYPYDGTVFPRGIGAAPLMWLGAASGDAYYLHASSATFDFQAYFFAPAGRYDPDPTVWQQLTDSTSGPARVKVARWDGTRATVVADQTWTVAPGSMRGTVYYWSVNDESVVRITAGSTAPENFLGSSGPAENHAPYCPSCHTVSANGRHLLMNEGTWGVQPSPVEQTYDYDLVASTSAGPFVPNANTSICESDGCPSEWGLAAVSPDGATLVENFSNLRGQIGKQTGAFDTATAQPIAGTGLEGQSLCMPAFSPDGLLLAYVDCTSMDLRAFDWDPVGRKATHGRLVSSSAQSATWPQIQYPTVSPDHRWIVYARGPSLGSLGNPGDLYAASVAAPGPEIVLAALDGTSYPFAAGARDRDLSFEPTFAPVASGGYFWIVFHSRRTWGNAITKAAYGGEGVGVKQLWVAAFDQAPQPGVDPSHPALHLPGQGTTATNGNDPINMRGSWALSPCKAEGQTCQSGTDCCGGFCWGSTDGGLACRATSSGCSGDGDRCTSAHDCCDGSDSCINGFCAQAPLQ